MKLLIQGRFDEQMIERTKKQWDTTVLPRRPGQPVDEKKLIDALQGMDVFLTEGGPITPSILAALPQLKAVVVAKGNPNSNNTIDVAAATEAGVIITNAPGRNSHSVCEMCVMLMITVARNFERGMNMVRSGEWARGNRADQYASMMGVELAGRTVGLVGLGAIGRLVARALGALNMRVLAYDPYQTQIAADVVGAQLVSLDELLRESDFVSMHVHVNRETLGMIGEREFAMMKPTAYLINTGRPGCVVEEELIKALQDKRIAGAALDVFHVEPLPEGHPFMSMTNVVMLPHVGSATYDVVGHHSRLVEVDLAALRNNRIPPHLFNTDILRGGKIRLEVK